MGKTILTHFAKQKIEQKKNSFHEKNSKRPKYITIESKHKSTKKTL
jgi:hypothetical protein